MSSTPYLGGRDAVPGFEQIASGKVRDIYAIDDEHLLFVASDRISAFDVVMDVGVPHKGRVLTQIAAFWFERTRDICPNHVASTSVDDVQGLDASWRETLRDRVMIVKKAVPSTVEWVVRGYIAGSGWKEYGRHGTVCGIALPAGLELASRLPEPILTPTTKDDDHDRPLTPDEARAEVGSELFDAAECAALALFGRGTEVLRELGILLADTKFEFGLIDGELVLIDEALTPDSSRFWPEDEWRTGISPPSYDKQILRDYLETLDWDKNYPAPELDPAVIDRVAARYLDIAQKITGRALAEARA